MAAKTVGIIGMGGIGKVYTSLCFFPSLSYCQAHESLLPSVDFDQLLESLILSLTLSIQFGFGRIGYRQKGQCIRHDGQLLQQEQTQHSQYVLFHLLPIAFHRKVQGVSSNCPFLAFVVSLLVEAEHNAHFAAYDTLLRESDVIVICTPLTPATRHMIGAAQFDKMKKGVVVINIARGPIIDEAALVKALESGKVSAECDQKGGRKKRDRRWEKKSINTFVFACEHFHICEIGWCSRIGCIRI